MAYDDLRDAVRSIALVRSSETEIIINNRGTRDPWLFDFRALMLQPVWLDRYAEIFWELYADRLPFQVGGMETAGIPLVAAIVMKGVERGTPVNGFYIRKSRKRTGRLRWIEGTLTQEPVILVDDLINSGGSILKQAAILEEEGMAVADAFAMLAFRAKDAYAPLAAKGIALKHLFTLEDFGMPFVRAAADARDAFETIWRFTPPHPSLQLVVEKSAPALDGKRVFFGSDAGTFYALDQASGMPAWTFDVGPHPDGKGILSSPVVHDGRVFFGAYDGNVYALDAETGSEAWRYADADWIGSSPALAPDLGLLFIGLEFGLLRRRGGIAALSLADGSLRWRHITGELTHCSPLYIPEEDMVVIGSNDGVAYAYDARSGAERWRYPSGGEIKSSFAYDPARRLVLFGAMDGTFYALTVDGAPVAARDTGAGIYSTPLVRGDTVYVASLGKRLYAIDLDTWQDRWVFETNGRIFASPALFEGSLWIGSNDGRLCEIDPATGTLRGSFRTTERIVNKIACADGRLFVPTVANEIICIRCAER